MSAPVHEALPESTPEAADTAETGESRHRYPPRAVLLDYLYSGLGLLFTLGPLGLAASGGPAAWVLGALAALFAVYGVRTLLRHRTWLSVSEDGVTVHGLLRRHLPWERLTRCTLGYYSTRRKRDRGWMQLTLKAGRRASGSIRRSKGSTRSSVAPPTRPPRAASPSTTPRGRTSARWRSSPATPTKPRHHP